MEAKVIILSIKVELGDDFKPQIKSGWGMGGA